MKTRAALVALFLVVVACSSESSAPVMTPRDPLSGGATTVYDQTKLAYGQMAPTVKDATRADAFSFGHAVFDRNWVTAPATTDDMDGLGPLYNQRSCSACHSHDGRSAPFDPKGAMLGMLLRISVQGADPHGGPLGDATYGTQIRPSAITGVVADAIPHVSYEEVPGTYGDGTAYSLQRPHYSIDTWGFGAPASEVMISARVGPITIGLGLLEAIPEDAIVANIKTNDPDGVRGHVNHVWDAAGNKVSVGRLGWKANVPSVLDQTTGALNGDMGITSALAPNESCGTGMTACKAAVSGGGPEIDGARLDGLVFYMRTLGVPARRSVDDPIPLHGEKLFSSMGCASCHTPAFKTGSLPDLPEVEDQTIHPYTDLLVHDMGPDLADGRPDYEASGSEWRTSPLWGIGLLQTVNGHELLLHDARARGLAEAILWHGGEATTARERFRNASASDRDAVVAFLHSL